jgi:hypothetical protein
LEYLCDMKSRLLSQTHEPSVLPAELNHPKEEKSDLQARIPDVRETQKFERETAYAVESSLREHCARSHEVYNYGQVSGSSHFPSRYSFFP